MVPFSPILLSTYSRLFDSFHTAGFSDTISTFLSSSLSITALEYLLDLEHF